MVWLGVDLGDSRVGLALSDPELTFAYPLETLPAYGNPSQIHVFDAVIDIMEEHAVERVVVGLPISMNGTYGDKAAKARKWAERLQRQLVSLVAAGDYICSDSQVPMIVLQDERLTTVNAHQQLHEACLSHMKRKPIIDQQAAVLILQSALEKYHIETDGDNAV